MRVGSRGGSGIAASLLCLAAWLILSVFAAPALAASGRWERAWGKNVDAGNPSTGFEICIDAAFCQKGSIGVRGGEISGPLGVAADAAGNVYVVDFGNER